MFQLRYKNEILDITPGQRLERQRNNPMFLIDDLFGENSDQLTVEPTDKNIRLIGAIFFDHSIKQKVKLPVEVLHYDTFAYNATLVIESSKVDRDITGRGKATGFLLSGLSNFLNKIKDVKASTLSLGGTRTLNFTTNDPTDLSDGYVQHFQNTWDNSYNYITAPVHNDLWTGDKEDENANGWMNFIGDDANLFPGQAYVLFPRLKYVLESIFREYGWILDTSAMAGTNWENIFMFSVKPLFTLDVTWSQELVGDQYINLPSATYKPVIEFRLAEWISEEVTIKQLLFDHCKRYGWVPLCDDDSNTCRLVPLRNAGTGRVKDWTKYASRQANSDFSGEPKIFAFRNTFPSNDEFPSSPNFEGYTLGAPVEKKADLPSPLGNYDNTVIYSYRENQWFKIDLNEETNQREWVVYADNIYDEDPDNATDDFDTTVTTLPVYLTKYRSAAGTDYYGLFPVCEQSRNKPWGLRTLYYHGLVDEVKIDGTAGPKKYPYLSSIRILPDGTESGNWSNVYRHKNGANDCGIIPYWWQPWCTLIGLRQEDDQPIFLPLYELRDFRWDDIINLFNIPYLVKSLIEPMPYTGFIQAKLQRLAFDAGDIEDEGGEDAPLVYLKMVFENATFTDFIDASTPFTPGMNYTDVTQGDWIIHIYSDAAGTIPALPTVPLTVNVELRTQNDDNPDPVIVSQGFHMNTLGQLEALGTPYVIHDYSDAVLNIPPNPPSHFTRAFKLLPGTGYEIIP